MSYKIQEIMADPDKRQLWGQVEELKAALAEKERELQQIREHEFQHGLQEGRALNDKLQADLDQANKTNAILRLDMEYFEQCQNDLDQVVGEAVKCVMYLASPYIDDSMRQTAQETFMGHPIVQSWKARQQEVV